MTDLLVALLISVISPAILAYFLNRIHLQERAEDLKRVTKKAEEIAARLHLATALNDAKMVELLIIARGTLAKVNRLLNPNDEKAQANEIEKR